MQWQTLVLAPHEGFIPSELWLKCRKKLLASHTYQPARKARNTWTAGKIKCGKCGYALMSAHSNGILYMRCTVHADSGACPGCGCVKLHELEAVVYGAMVKKLKDFKTLTGRKKAAKIFPKLTAKRLELAQVESEIEKPLDTLTGASPVLLSYVNSRIEELDAKRQSISNEIAKLSADAVPAEKIESISGYLDEDENFIIDTEAAPVVKQIYSLCLAGNGPTKIARMLTEQETHTPGTLEYRRTGSRNGKIFYTSITSLSHMGKKSIIITALNNLYLTHLHRFQSIAVAFRSHTGTAAGPDTDRSTRKRRFKKKGVRYNADIRTQAHQLNRIIILVPGICRQFHTAERRLFKTLPFISAQRAADLPSFCILFTVFHRKVLSFQSLKIIVIMCVHRKDNLLPLAFVLLNPRPHLRNDFPGLLCSQRAIHKIILHVNNYQQFFHFNTIPFHPTGRPLPKRHTGSFFC